MRNITMTNAGDWPIAFLIIIVIIMPILRDIISEWRVMSFDSFTNFLLKLKRIWGGIFRFLFITLVGFIGYNWIDPQPIGDIPFSQLTLKLIFNNLFAVGIVILCFVSVFCPPDMVNQDEYYNTWADLSGLLLIVIGIIWAYM